MVQSLYKLTLASKSHMRNLDNFRQAVESQKKKENKFDGLLLSKKYICPKNIFVPLKHHIQRIYLTLISSTCANIHQITYVIFETVDHF